MSQFTPLVTARLVILGSLFAAFFSLLLCGFTNPVVSAFFLGFLAVSGVAEFLPLTAERWVFPKFPVFKTSRAATLTIGALPLLWSPPRTAGYFTLVAAAATFAKPEAQSQTKLLEAPMEERIYQVL